MTKTKTVRFDGVFATISNADTQDADVLRRKGYVIANEEPGRVVVNLWPGDLRQPLDPGQLRSDLGLDRLVLGAGEPKTKSKGGKLVLSREETSVDMARNLGKLYASADRQAGRLHIGDIRIVGKHAQAQS